MAIREGEANRETTYLCLASTFDASCQPSYPMLLVEERQELVVAQVPLAVVVELGRAVAEVPVVEVLRRTCQVYTQMRKSPSVP